MANAGEFNALLRAGEEPQRVRIADDKDFQPGPIPRFAEKWREAHRYDPRRKLKEQA